MELIISVEESGMFLGIAIEGNLFHHFLNRCDFLRQFLNTLLF